MSSYEKRFEVHYNHCSFYTDDPEEALRLSNRDPEHGWVAEGYPCYHDMEDGRTMITRRFVNFVLPSTLEFMVQRAKVQCLIYMLKGN